jgi:hypothetical protein
MLPIRSTNALTNMPTTTIETAGIVVLYFFGNQELIPNTETHLTSSFQEVLRFRKGAAAQLVKTYYVPNPSTISDSSKVT